jgi:hypothetical protein
MEEDKYGSESGGGEFMTKTHDYQELKKGCPG